MACIQHHRPLEPWTGETRQGRNIASIPFPTRIHTSSCGAGRKGGWILVGPPDEVDEVAGQQPSSSSKAAAVASPVASPVASGVPTSRHPLDYCHTANGPLFSRRLLQRQTIVMCDPRLHPITACRWRLHRCTRGRYDWRVGHIACTPLRRSVESHGGLARSLSTWAMPTNWTHHRLFLSMGPALPPNHKQFVS